MKYKPFACIILIGVLTILPILINNVSAGAQPNYYVTVKPTTPNSPMYTTVNRDWTLSFEALWSYGADSGGAISNASATIQVTNRENKIVDALSFNTTKGIFTFNYTSATADILTFTPTNLATQDGKEWTNIQVDSANNVYGLQAQSAIVWWDTFHVSLLSSDTGNIGKIAISANITYLLLPEGGLTLPEWATYSNQTFLPKTASSVNVNINGVKAKESQTSGIYSADSSTFLPTAYVNIQVAQEGWTTTNTGFSFSHNANQPLWMYGVAIGSAFTFSAVMLYFFKSKKANNAILVEHPNFPFYGGISLAATSVVSLYWGLVWLEGTLHTFDWLPFALLGMLTFTFGIAGSIMSLRKKNQALAIFAITLPMFTNLIGVKFSLDAYQLTIPWLMLIASMILTIASGYFICNADENFKMHSSEKKIPA